MKIVKTSHNKANKNNIWIKWDNLKWVNCGFSAISTLSLSWACLLGFKWCGKSAPRLNRFPFLEVESFNIDCYSFLVHFLSLRSSLLHFPRSLGWSRATARIGRTWAQKAKPESVFMYLVDGLFDLVVVVGILCGCLQFATGTMLGICVSLYAVNILYEYDHPHKDQRFRNRSIFCFTICLKC